MPVRPVAPADLVRLLIDRLMDAAPGERVNAAVDGPPPAEPELLAEAVADGLRSRGRPAAHVRTTGYLRPASLRFELGRANPDSYYENWYDLGALRREVLDRTDRILPTYWDPVIDRSTRARYVELGAAAVVLVSGDLLLGTGLPFDFTVHMELSFAALARRTPPELSWTLPAYRRYAAEVDPAAFADLVVRVNNPEHPALVTA